MSDSLVKERVLVIDHDIAARRLYKMQFSYAGMAYDLATTAREGLRKLSLGYDAVLVEMTLPDVDGLTVASTIRERSDCLSGIPIIGVSRLPINGITRQCAQARINALMRKPIDPIELAATVRRYSLKPDSVA